MKSFRDYLGLSNSCSYDVDDVIGRADRFGFQNFCSPVHEHGVLHLANEITHNIDIEKKIWSPFSCRLRMKCSSNTDID